MSYEDRRKRGYPNDDIGAAINNKRAALGLATAPHPHFQAQQDVSQDSLYGTSESLLYFKLLCPQGMTGIIIGKGGATINQLNISTGAKIKLSQNNEFFPTTSDRVLVLSGDRLCLQNAVTELVTRIAETAEKKTHGPENNKPHHVPPNRGPDGSYMIRVVIPRPSAGLLIGRGGAVVKQMEETSRCKFQLGEEADPFGTNERIMIVNASSSADLVQGVQNIMHQLLNNPRVRVYTNVTTVYDPVPPSAPHLPLTGTPRPMGTGPPSGPPAVPPSSGMMYAPAAPSSGMIHAQAGMYPPGNYQQVQQGYSSTMAMAPTPAPVPVPAKVNRNVPGAHTNTAVKMAHPAHMQSHVGSQVPAAPLMQGGYGQPVPPQQQQQVQYMNPYMQAQPQAYAQQQQIPQSVPSQHVSTPQPQPQAQSYQQYTGYSSQPTAGIPQSQQISQQMPQQMQQFPQQGYVAQQPGTQYQGAMGQAAMMVPMPQGVMPQGMMSQQGMVPGMMPGLQGVPMQGMPMQPQGMMPQGMPQQGMMMAPAGQYAMTSGAYPTAGVSYVPASYAHQQQGQVPQPQQQVPAQYAQYAQYQYYDPSQTNPGAAAYGGKK